MGSREGLGAEWGLKAGAAAGTRGARGGLGGCAPRVQRWGLGPRGCGRAGGPRAVKQDGVLRVDVPPMLGLPPSPPPAWEHLAGPLPKPLPQKPPHLCRTAALPQRLHPWPAPTRPSPKRI